MVTKTGTLCTGEVQPQEMPPKNILELEVSVEGWENILTVGKTIQQFHGLFSPALPPSLGAQGLREPQEQSWTMVHPKSFPPPSAVQQTLGTGSAHPREGQAGAQQWLWQQQRGVASKFHPGHAMVQHVLPSHTPEFIQGKTREESVEQINILLHMAAPRFGPDLFTVPTAGCCCAQIYPLEGFGEQGCASHGMGGGGGEPVR